MTGGQGLVKRMSKAGGAGGMEKIKEDYPKWIFEQLRLEEEVKAKKMRILISLTQATQKSSILITRKEL